MVTSSSGTQHGRLKMVIDLTADPPISFESEARATLPALVQEDLNEGGLMYEFALATYDIDELNASNIVSNTPIDITPIQSVSRDDIAGIVKSNTTASKTLNMTLSGTTLTITYN